MLWHWSLSNVFEVNSCSRKLIGRTKLLPVVVRPMCRSEDPSISASNTLYQTLFATYNYKNSPFGTKTSILPLKQVYL